MHILFVHTLLAIFFGHFVLYLMVKVLHILSTLITYPPLTVYSLYYPCTYSLMHQASSYTTLPEQVLPELLEAPSFTVRELPYSIDFLIENFMDPAHIPFAHHSMQGVRSDGRAIPMQKLTTLENATHCEIGYQDAIRGKPRDGVVSFTAPCYYHFRVKETTPSGTEQFRKQLIAVLGGSPYAAPSTTPTPTNPPPLSKPQPQPQATPTSTRTTRTWNSSTNLIPAFAPAPSLALALALVL